MSSTLHGLLPNLLERRIAAAGEVAHAFWFERASAVALIADVSGFTRLAERLAAPVVKPLFGKGVIPDDNPFSVGGIGLLGTKPAQEALEACDTLLIAGSTFPYIEYYPKPGKARAVQIELENPAPRGTVGDGPDGLRQVAGAPASENNRTAVWAIRFPETPRSMASRKRSPSKNSVVRTRFAEASW